MACFVFGAGDFCGLSVAPGPNDYIIAADGGWMVCQQIGIVPDLLIGDFDSLDCMPAFEHVKRVPVEKDDTDMMLAVKEGMAKGESTFHLFGGMGGPRTDHTIANLQTLLYLAKRGARGYLYGNREIYTAIFNDCITLPSRDRGIFSVFCIGEDADGVSINGGQYHVEDVRLSSEFPLGVSNHFINKPVIISVKRGSLLIGIHE